MTSRQEAVIIDIDNHTAVRAVALILAGIQVRLDEAARIARVATACAQAGGISEAVTLALDIEQPVHEAGRLLDAASLLNRLTEA